MRWREVVGTYRYLAKKRREKRSLSTSIYRSEKEIVNALNQEATKSPFRLISWTDLISDQTKTNIIQSTMMILTFLSITNPKIISYQLYRILKILESQQSHVRKRKSFREVLFNQRGLKRV